MLESNEITILCKVIDNFGDIGVVYRLARSISGLDSSLKLNLVVSDLNTFSKMAGEINPSLSMQQFRGWTILNWNDSETCKNYFKEHLPLNILECFQCGRPDWLDDILFSPEFSNSGLVSRIVNIEYLTAEEWADDFHLKRGATSSASVKKAFYMPGFTEKTGGLILDKNFILARNDKKYRKELLSQIFKTTGYNENDFNILMFSYPKNFDFFFNALNQFSKESSKKIHVFTAPGAGKESFEKTAAKFNQLSFSMEYLPYMNQELWDSFLCSMDFLFIRGEDSFARAALTGKPFLWNIYQQDEEYHLVKLKAFLDRLNCPQINEFSWLYNRNFNLKAGDEALDAWKNISSINDSDSAQKRMEELLVSILKNYEKISPVFKSFADRTESFGNLAQKVIEFLPLIK